MKTDFKKMSLGRTLLAGLFSGFITAVVIVIFDIIYRQTTDFEKISSIGPLLIFTAIPLLTVTAGMIYFLMVHYFKKGELFFIIFFALLTLVSMMIDIGPVIGNEKLLSVSGGLLFGIEIITGMAICIFIPFLAHHPTIYMTAERLKWEK